MIPPQGYPPDTSFGGGRKKRRANCHDYHLKGTYHLVLEVNSRRPLLGSLLCDPKPRVALSHIGERLLSDELPKIHQYYPMVDLWKHCIMPDHLHLILRVNSELLSA